MRSCTSVLSRKSDLEAVVDSQLRELAKRLSERRLKLDVTEAAEAWLARRGQ